MKQVIIFGNDHTNSIGLIHSMGIVGYECIALVFGLRTGFVKSSKFTKDIISASSAQGCIDNLLATDLGKNKKMVIIAGCDTAALTLEKNANKLTDRFLFEYASKYTLDYISKKENQVRLAKEAGFNVPKTWNLKDSKTIPEDVCYPCLIKPLVSCEGAKSDIRVCNTKEELEYNLNDLNCTTNVLLQQYIDRDYEISILGCGLTNGKCLLPAVENKLTLFPKYVGLECLANIQKLTDEEIIISITNLIESLGYVGLFSVEMMHCKSDNKFYFTEVNLRNDGAEAFITKYGANLPLNHVEDMKGLPLTPQTEENPGYYIWDMHHLKSLLYRDISILTWIKEIRMSNGFLMYLKEDRKPFFRQYMYMLEKLLRINKNRSY